MLTYALSGDVPITEEDAKKKFEEAIASGDPVGYAVAAGAGVACTAIGGPWTGALCSLGAKALWGKIFGGTCSGQGGTIWALKEYAGGGDANAWRKPEYWRSLSPPVPAKDREKWHQRTTCAVQASQPLNPRAYPGCITVAYCQLPGMPEPKPPSPLSVKEQMQALLESKGRFITPTAQKAATQYTHGSVTSQNPETGLWRVASPRTELSGEAAYVVVDERSTQPSGVSVVTYPDFLRRTGELAWYKDWRVWAITGTVVAAGAGGLLLWKRRKRRKRR